MNQIHLIYWGVKRLGHQHDFSWHFRKFEGGRPMRIGIGGPVGSGKTQLVKSVASVLKEKYEIGVITNDIYTKEDEANIKRSGILPEDRVIGVETGGCPHTAVREDVSMNMDAVEQLDMTAKLDMIFIESGGDNLAAAFSPELADVFLYVIDVAQGDDIPRKGGAGIIQSDLLIVNKIELAPYVQVDLEGMKRDANEQRKERPTVFSNLLTGIGVEEIASWLDQHYSDRKGSVQSERIR